MRNIIALLLLSAWVAFGLTSCVSIDPAPGFHFDSHIQVDPPVIVRAESHAEADVLKLSCWVLDFLSLRDDVPLCAVYDTPAAADRGLPNDLLQQGDAGADNPDAALVSRDAGALGPAMVVALTFLTQILEKLRRRVDSGQLGTLGSDLDHALAVLRDAHAQALADCQVPAEDVALAEDVVPAEDVAHTTTKPAQTPSPA